MTRLRPIGTSRSHSCGWSSPFRRSLHSWSALGRSCAKVHSRVSRHGQRQQLIDSGKALHHDLAHRFRIERLGALMSAYMAAGYVPAGRLLATSGNKGNNLPAYLRATRRLPLAEALHAQNVLAAAMLIDRGDLGGVGMPRQTSQLREFKVRLPLAGDVSPEEALCLYADLVWGSRPGERALVTAALMQHRIRKTTEGNAAAAKLETPVLPARRRQL